MEQNNSPKNNNYKFFSWKKDVLIIFTIFSLIFSFCQWFVCNNTPDCYKFGGILEAFVAFIAFFIIQLFIFPILDLLNFGLYKILSKNFKSSLLAVIPAILVIICIYDSTYPLMPVAYLTKNVNFCKLIKSSSDEAFCVLMIAKSKSDKSLCELLTDDVLRDYCLNEFQKTIK
jgi:hypothetical protein